VNIPRRVTVKTLQDMGACWDACEKFKIWYPEGVELTLASLAKAQRRGFDVGWFARRLLYRSTSEAAQRRYWDNHRIKTPLGWLRAELRRRKERAR